MHAASLIRHSGHGDAAPAPLPAAAKAQRHTAAAADGQKDGYCLSIICLQKPTKGPDKGPAKGPTKGPRPAARPHSPLGSHGGPTSPGGGLQASPSPRRNLRGLAIKFKCKLHPAGEGAWRVGRPGDRGARRACLPGAGLSRRVAQAVA